MIVKFLGHSSFFICGKYSVVTDPFSKIGFDMERMNCDFCISSHNHFDHNAFSEVNCKVKISSLENQDLGEKINLKFIPSFHDEVFGAKRGNNLISKFNIDGIEFCHLGDFGEKISDEIVNKIGQTDVLFVPVGGKFTISEKDAVKIIELVKPKIAIPMHYGTPKSTVGVAKLDTFLSFNDFPIENKEQSFEIELENLPTKTTIFIPSSKGF